MEIISNFFESNPYILELRRSGWEFAHALMESLKLGDKTDPYEGLPDDQQPYPAFGDLKWFVIAFFMSFIVRYLVDTFIIYPFSRSQLRKHWPKLKKQSVDASGKPLADNYDAASFEKTAAKIAESAWKTLYYTVTWCFGMYAASREAFFYDRTQYFKDYPYHPISFELKAYYVISMAFYSSSIIQCLFETKRKDFVEMFIHHIVTSLLIGLSYFLRFYRIGVMVLLVHDINDIILESMKCFRYLGYVKISDNGFIVFALSWIVSRFYLFTYLILLNVTNVMFGYVDPTFKWYFIFAILLHILLELHVYWFYLIIKVATIAAKKGTVDDIREEAD